MIEDTFSAEVAILSILLKNGILLDKPELIILKPGMFSSSPHKEIYSLFLDLKRDNILLDYSVFLTRATDVGYITNCGGSAYIKYLLEQNFNENNLLEFVNSVVNAFKIRELSKLTEAVSSGVINNSDADKIISELKAQLNILESGTSVDGSIIKLEKSNEAVVIELEENLGKPIKIAHSTGSIDLDAVTGGYLGGELWTIAGRPGSGKTAFICNSILSGIPTLFLSLEMGSKPLSHRFLSILSGVPIFNIRLGKINKAELELIKASAKKIKDLPIYLDTTFYLTPEYLTNIIRKYKKLYDIKTVYLDYIQLMVERGITATHDIGRVTRDLKLLVLDLDITVILTSQLNRACESREGDKRPMLSDIRQSGNVEEDSDVVVALYRDILYNPDSKNKDKLELIIRKQRQGPIGTVIVGFEDSTNRIYELKRR